MKILSTAMFGTATVLLLGLGVTTPAYSQNPNDLKQLLETRFCQGCDLRGANLSGAHLIGVDLRDANLAGANLANANLEGADLKGANLTAANLEGAFLNQVEFNHANLTAANLTDANLVQAQLDGANLLNADLTGSEFAIPTVQTAELPKGSADDLGIPEMGVGLDSRLTFPVGGPELDEPFEYSQEYLDQTVNPTLNSSQAIDSDPFLRKTTTFNDGMRGDVNPSGTDLLKVDF
ncbi:Pentapeptide repeat protein [Planktothrix serta PCC 8927]|uniref:Pentapeptide repeat protein n=1 Tax=Planktothrix serta PCC 8927 TaxID=671068 RepID=A0A7Z9DV09_9CYAN|nr:pentapeptide repeat-containing protein [Planktothrix serta]VXD12338.1 Pentapeptide repeat protein [Planktothrix serta PCC 8927]